MMKIMIVEDDPVLARELELLLKKWDFRHAGGDCF